MFLIGIMMSSPELLPALSTSSLMAIKRTPSSGKVCSRYFPVSTYSLPSRDRSLTITQLARPRSTASSTERNPGRS